MAVAGYAPVNERTAQLSSDLHSAQHQGHCYVTDGGFCGVAELLAIVTILLQIEVFPRVPRAPLEQFDRPPQEIVLRLDRMYITKLSFLGGCT
jgi:hypothetical protein